MSKLQLKHLVGLILAGILVLAVGLRTYQLSSLPFDLDGDFASCGIEAIKILSGQYAGLTDLGWSGIPVIGYVSTALGIAVFGQNLIGLSFVAVVMGVLTVLLVYKLGQVLFNVWVGLAAAGFLTVSYAHIQLSRIPTFGDPVFWLTISSLWAGLALMRQKSYYWILSGSASGLAFVMYFSGRIGILIFSLVFLWQIMIAIIQRNKSLFIFWLQNSALWSVGFMFFILPFVPSFLANWSAFLIRSREVFIFHPAVLAHMSRVYEVTSTSQVIFRQIQTTLLTLHATPDTSTQFGFFTHMVDKLTFVLAMLGLGIGLRYFKQWRFQLLTTWLISVLVVGAVLTSNPPFWPRIISLLIPVCLLAGVGFYAVGQKILSFSWTKRTRIFFQLCTAIVVVVGFCFLTVHNWQVYIKHKATQATDRTHLARYILNTDSSVKYVLIADKWHFRDREFLYLIPGRILSEISADQFQTQMNSTSDADGQENPHYIMDYSNAQLIISQLSNSTDWQIRPYSLPNSQQPIFYELWLSRN